MSPARLGGLGPMLGKETLEGLRTGRWPVTLVLYLMVGLGSPLLARALPELIALVPPEQMGGVEILLTEAPDTADALAQYLKNLQMMPLVGVLVAMGAIGQERARGVAAMLLSLPLSRTAWVGAKVLAHLGLHLAGTTLAAAGCLLYTRVLFGPIDPAGFAALNGLVLLFTWTLVAVTLLGASAFRGAGAAAGLGLAAYAASVALAAVPSVGRVTPAGLLVAASDLVVGRDPEALAWSLGGATLLVAASVAWAIRIQARREV